MKLINQRIYLASKSPRRKELLERIAADVTIITVDTAETVNPELHPPEIAKAIALEKMEAAKVLPGLHGIVITADTIVSIGDTVLGKPVDEADARRMLRLLSGTEHQVYTGYCVYNTESGKRILDVAETDVTFHRLTDEEIGLYCQSGGPFDKAGAYGIQDAFGSVFISGIRGCYYNVMGLPVSQLYHSINSLAETC
jgi:septum formation protein